ncbi:MAG: NAD-dependent epimerase/dehydratase family protein [Candidatus Kapabacteria bacterium]|nr:NAD-dependent epimerase/dehydratase family protein [Candidatus Kapabacteria bacterium]
MKKEIKKLLVTGASGQIGSELIPVLRNKYGDNNVIATDLKIPTNNKLFESGPFHLLDVRNYETLESIIKNYNIDTIIHLAAILSGIGEDKPEMCWDINMGGTVNTLNLAVKYEMARVFIPSSIAVWGPGMPKKAPQDSVLQPTTMYGITKVAGELIGDYYIKKFGLDVRGVRYPGIISSETPPGGGTTDYAVAIYYDAIKYNKFVCFVNEETTLPMMYMPDCIKAVLDLLDAPFEKLKHHTNFNVGSMSFNVRQLVESIRKYKPNFEIKYEPDFHQEIADSWPDDVDDSAAREEWGWKPDWDLDSMTKDMITKLEARLLK